MTLDLCPSCERRMVQHRNACNPCEAAHRSLQRHWIAQGLPLAWAADHRFQSRWPTPNWCPIHDFVRSECLPVCWARFRQLRRLQVEYDRLWAEPVRVAA